MDIFLKKANDYGYVGVNSVFLMQMWFDYVNRQVVETGAAAKPSRFIKMARPPPVTER